MGISYTPIPVGISDLIKNSSQDATYLVPDLQRPYVWKPNQVILLIDSLFRGWPFGSLLTWEVKTNSFGNDGIPPRAFWHIVDRTRSDDGQKALAKGQPATYYMILDGQQRIQSMLIALGGDAFGFKMYDHDWYLDKEIRKPVTSHWSQASLHLDVKAFEEAMNENENELNRVSIENILAWVITSEELQSKKPLNYESPLSNLWEHPNRFIRFSRLWSIAESGISEYRYSQLLPEFLIKQEISCDNSPLLIQRLAILLRTISEIKSNTQIQTLQINALTVSSQWTVDDYNDAIVNIFTRLNTAGRTLTREEITLAWLKVSWKSDYIDDNKSAGECLEDLRAMFEDENIDVSIDELVRLLSFFWVVQTRKGELLNDRDLLKGNVLTPMAHDISKDWNYIRSTLNYAIKELNSRDLIGSTGSFNALIVCWCWLFIADKWGIANQINMKVRTDDAYCKTVDELFRKFMDQWLFVSQWANVWAANATKNLQSYARILNTCYSEVSIEKFPDEVINTLESAIQNLLAEVQKEAETYVRTLEVTSRTRVSIYRSLLWVWQRLNLDRFEKTTILLKIGRQRKDFPPEVDHIIADAYWQERLTQEIQRLKDNGIDLSVPEGEPEKGPVEFENKIQAEVFINKIGNCSLLKKGFNISKGKDPMWNFLTQVHEFANNTINRDDWEKAISVSNRFTSPENYQFAELKDAIDARTKQIRDDLTDFIYGRQARQDI